MAQKKNATAVSDEQIIAALMNCSSIQQAAESIGIAPRTIYDRMNDPEFKAMHEAAKAEILQTALDTLNKQLIAAINTIAEIMNEKEGHAATRLQAARMILDSAERFANRLNSSYIGIADAASVAATRDRTAAFFGNLNF